MNTKSGSVDIRVTWYRKSMRRRRRGGGGLNKCTARADLDDIQLPSPLENCNDEYTLPPESHLDFARVNDEILSNI